MYGRRDLSDLVLFPFFLSFAVFWVSPSPSWDRFFGSTGWYREEVKRGLDGWLTHELTVLSWAAETCLFPVQWAGFVCLTFLSFF